MKVTTRGALATVLLLGSPCLAQTAAPAMPGPAAEQTSPRRTDATGANDAQTGVPATVTHYDLDVHLRPAESGISVVARIGVRNTGSAPLTKVALELSSTLRWDAVAERLNEREAPRKLQFDQHQRETDTDHTGAEQEAEIALSRPLAPGAVAELTVSYSGTLGRSSGRLTRSGVPAVEAQRLDWDGISEEGTALRGFGDVLWYPVSAPPIFLGDGARLAEETGRQSKAQSNATARLRLQVEYTAAPAEAAFFCGRLVPLRPLEEEAGAAAGEASGLAVGEFSAMPLGFGVPSLFVVRHAPQLEGRTVGVVTADAGSAARVETAAASALPLIKEWLGAARERQPVLLDHLGQPFAQGALLVQSADDADNSFAMVHLLSHAWFQSDEVWLDEGLAQFLPILQIERDHGRQAALAQMEEQRPALVLAESNAATHSAGLPAATSEVFFRNKAVAVLWMLRALAGDDAMKKSLLALRSRPLQDRGSAAFEAALEAASGKDLGWFFKDWVLADKGLPELSIVSVAVRPDTGRQGSGDGSLVALEVKNDGGAAAEVPVTVRSGELTTTERLRIPGHGSASIRILFQGRPQQVEVNDGSVPEIGESRHLRHFEP